MSSPASISFLYVRSHFTQLKKRYNDSSRNVLNMIYVKIWIVERFRHQVGELMLLKKHKTGEYGNDIYQVFIVFKPSAM